MEGLLLDVGGPLMRVPFEFMAEVERSYGLAPGTIRRRGPFDPATDPQWRDREAGLLSEQAYWSQWATEVERAAGRGGGLPDFLATCYQPSGPGAVVRSETVALVADAREAGIKVGAVTNDLAFLFPGGLPEALSVLADLDTFVDLSHAAVCKPHPDAYGIALRALDLAPNRVLFVDDHPINVGGAEAVGMEALHFDITDPARTVRRIRGCLGLARR